MSRAFVPQQGILILTCADRPGIVAAVAMVLASHGCNIEESAQYGAPDTGRFFMRIRFSLAADTSLDTLRAAFRPVAQRFTMWWELHDAARRPRIMIMVSQTSHCLNELIYRWRIGTLPVRITRVASNHDKLRELVEREGVPFDVIPVASDDKAQAEAALMALFEQERCDLLVLARYMQILSPELAQRLAGRVINIHHAFLPGFKGARPYARAHKRGVKLIGATAHFVTADLDEGPIIEQETERVDHSMSVAEFINVGRDIERKVLARAVRYFAEHRILLNDGKTVIFR